MIGVDLANRKRERLRVLGEKLIHHQLWFFGRDIWHPEGNLLIRRGFERSCVPEGAKGSNAYRLTLDGGRELILWGFGVYFGVSRLGGVFLKRQDLRFAFVVPTLLDLPIWESSQVICRPPASKEEMAVVCRLTQEAIDWILDYESWISNTCGDNWRKECLRDWANAELSLRQIKWGLKTLRRNLGDS